MSFAFPTKPLAEIADAIDYGVTASASTIDTGTKFLRITDIQDGYVDWATVPYCDAPPAKLLSAALSDGDIVFARTGATTGKSFLIKSPPRGAVFASYLIRVKPSSRIYPAYLAHFFQSQGYWSQIQKRTQGAAQGGVNATSLSEIAIPLPPLPEQRRVAAILDKADALRRKRKRAIGLLDSLTQSIFLEMFGDPATNPKCLERIALGDVIHSASDGPHVSPEYSETGIPFLSTRHIQRGRIVWDDLKFISSKDAAVHWKKCRPQAGDILYTKGGTTGLAAVVDTDKEFAVWVHVALLKTDVSKIEPYLLEAMLNSEFCYAQSQRYTHGIANRDLGLKRMVKIEMYLPSMAEQKQFVKATGVLRRMRLQVEQVSTGEAHLFSSLQSRAFSGQL